MAEPTPPPPGTPDQLQGRVLAGRYRLNRKIAAGGMAEVWEATDETLARRVAVKLLHRHLAADESFVRRFRAEAVAAARLAHPSIVSVYDTFSADGLEGIVMELVVGTTMRADLDQHGPMKLEAVLAIGTQVADALGVAHAAGLVHRDVKPANILLSTDGRVLVADFGIAKAAEGNDLTTAGSMVGTAKYLAPEQVEGVQIDGRADLYALGIVLYEALTGVPPFVADTDAGTALARLHRDPTPPRQRRPEISPAVERVVLTAMARSRHDRYPDAAAMRRALLDAGADPRRASAAAAAAASGPVAVVGAAPSGAPAGARPTAPAHGAGAEAGVGAPAAPPAPSHLAPPPPPPGAEPTPIASAPAQRRSRRWLAVVAVAALAAVAAAFAVQSGDDPPAEPGAVAIASATSFDPQGDNQTENEDQVGNAIDGDPATAWSTERYGDAGSMASAGAPDKTGVGLELVLDGEHDLHAIDVTTEEPGWAAQIYVATGDGFDDLAGWGEPVSGVGAATEGTTRFTLDDIPGDRVLIWFTRTAPSGTVRVSGVTVEGR